MVSQGRGLDGADRQTYPTGGAGYTARLDAAGGPHLNGAQRRRVAVLGGGPAAIAAAFELTAPELNGRFEVTVYQPGWRLGGKCASGRNLAACGRIEEHGLHVWFGFYDNAFRMMRSVYEELGRPPEHPIPTFAQAFRSCDELVLCDRQGDGFRDFRITFPRNKSEPGRDQELPNFRGVVARVCRLALRQSVGLGLGLGRAGQTDARVRIRGARERLMSRFAGAAARRAPTAGPVPPSVGQSRERAARPRNRAQLRHVHWEPARAGGGRAARPQFRMRLLASTLSRVRDLLWDHVVGARCAQNPALRLFFTTFDTLASAICGIAREGVLERGWQDIDDLDLCAWLGAHGAKPVTVGDSEAERAPLLRAVYDVAFANPGGDVAAPSAAAGTATRNLFRLLFGYRGSVLYKMRAGMGDTVMAPLYELLGRRGVRFEFFNAVTALHVAEDGKGVDAIELVPQVELASDSYEPLVGVEGLACWPSEPLWHQLREGAHLSRRGLDFELETNPLGREPVTVRRGESFDDVVLGIPVAVLPEICSEVAACNERFARMLDHAETVGTQALQLWLTRPTRELGWRQGENSVARTHAESLTT